MKQLADVWAMVVLFLLTTWAGPVVADKSPQNLIEWNRSQATPGIVLKHEEVAGTSKKGEVQYKLFAVGAPQNKDYELWSRWIDGDTGVLPNIRITDSGELAMELEGIIIPVILTLHNMWQAEPIEYALVSKDKTIKAFDTLIPFPVVAKSADGCQLELQLITPRGLYFAIIARGFEPNEEVMTRSVSGKEVIEGKTRASEDGMFITMINPGVAGKKGGKAKYTAKGRSCQVTLTYRWGKKMRRGHR